VMSTDHGCIASNEENAEKFRALLDTGHDASSTYLHTLTYSY